MVQPRRPPTPKHRPMESKAKTARPRQLAAVAIKTPSTPKMGPPTEFAAFLQASTTFYIVAYRQHRQVLRCAASCGGRTASQWQPICEIARAPTPVPRRICTCLGARLSVLRNWRPLRRCAVQRRMLKARTFRDHPKIPSPEMGDSTRAEPCGYSCRGARSLPRVAVRRSNACHARCASASLYEQQTMVVPW